MIVYVKSHFHSDPIIKYPVPLGARNKEKCTYYFKSVPLTSHIPKYLESTNINNKNSISTDPFS